MNYSDLSFCKQNALSPLYGPSTVCDFSKPMPDYQLKTPHTSAFTMVRGPIIDGRVSYSSNEEWCVSYYEVTVQTSATNLVNLIITSNTYSVDCGSLDKGTEVIGFYNSLATEANFVPPAYDTVVMAFSLQNRMIKADFFDCFLVSQDHLLQLEITNNTYVVDRNGKPYCGTLSNKYLVVLYSSATDSQPAITQPNVVIVL